MMISVEEAKRLAKRTLSAKRYAHTRNVQKLAVELARRNGVDEKQAALAALLHDIAKELPRDKMLQICAGNAIITEDMQKRPVPVWHGVAGAVLAHNAYGVQDVDILQAIACHSTGRADMTTLDKIIYLADMASEERDYPEAQILRAHAPENLDKAAVEGLGMSIAWLKAEGKNVDPATLEAYAALRKKQYGG